MVHVVPTKKTGTVEEGEEEGRREGGMEGEGEGEGRKIEKGDEGEEGKVEGEEGKVEGDLGEEDTDSAGLVLPQVSGLIPRPDSQSGNQTSSTVLLCVLFDNL